MWFAHPFMLSRPYLAELFFVQNLSIPNKRPLLQSCAVLVVLVVDGYTQQLDRLCVSEIAAYGENLWLMYMHN